MHHTRLHARALAAVAAIAFGAACAPRSSTQPAPGQQAGPVRDSICLNCGSAPADSEVSGTLSGMALVVVDGVVQPPGGTNPLIGMDPGDVASVQIMQPPEATARYGDAGREGAILVTTRHASAAPKSTPPPSPVKGSD
jgi:hypothetical protein